MPSSSRLSDWVYNAMSSRTRRCSSADVSSQDSVDGMVGSPKVAFPKIRTLRVEAVRLFRDQFVSTRSETALTSSVLEFKRVFASKGKKVLVAQRSTLVSRFGTKGREPGAGRPRRRSPLEASDRLLRDTASETDRSLDRVLPSALHLGTRRGAGSGHALSPDAQVESENTAGRNLPYSEGRGSNGAR